MNAPSHQNAAGQSPAQIATTFFRESPYQAIRCLKCKFRDGVLSIDGRLPSFYLAQLALTAVREIEGVQRIENLIEVAV